MTEQTDTSTVDEQVIPAPCAGGEQPETAGGLALPERLAGMLADLSTAGVEGLAPAQLIEVIGVLESIKGAAAGVQARATAAFVAGQDADVAERAAAGELSSREARVGRTGTRTQVALARRCSPNQGDRHVGLAKALVEDLPHTMAALTAGQISEWRATIVARETACLTHEDRMEADRRIAGCLTTSGDKALAGAAHRATVDLDQEALVRRRARAVASRNVSVRPAPEGMAWLSVLGPVVEVVGAFAALRAAEQARHVATGDPDVDAARAADERGRGAWLADTALERLSGRDEGQVQPVEVALVMSEGALLPSDESTASGSRARDEAEVPGHGALPGSMAREHLLRLCDTDTATWLRRVWTAPGGRDIVAMDSTRRGFGGVLRQLIELRDAACRIPWCDAPIRDIDHITAHARGGATTLANGWGLCQRHNLAKEAPGTTAEVTTGLDPGEGPHEVIWTTPTGHTYTSQAPPALGHGRPPPDSPLEAHLATLLAAA
ncbi:DUF222 domain-containing protein [Janibacter anophelis]|uniref:HNH endonuclease signature motif containing protein n=2 Tax=Janibacter anophelis TaxID=319054 RepID=UPI0039EF7755